jgi:hypothetical protein
MNPRLASRAARALAKCAVRCGRRRCSKKALLKMQSTDYGARAERQDRQIAREIDGRREPRVHVGEARQRYVTSSQMQAQTPGAEDPPPPHEVAQRPDERAGAAARCRGEPCRGLHGPLREVGPHVSLRARSATLPHTGWEWALRGSNPGPTDYENVRCSPSLAFPPHHSAPLTLNVRGSRHK